VARSSEQRRSARAHAIGAPVIFLFSPPGRIDTHVGVVPSPNRIQVTHRSAPRPRRDALAKPDFWTISLTEDDHHV